MMLSPAEEKQILIEKIADFLIDDDDYFLMDDPSMFLEWAAGEAHNYIDTDSEGEPAMDIYAMFTHWQAERASLAA